MGATGLRHGPLYSYGSLDYVTNALGQVTHLAFDYQGRLTTLHPDGYNVTNIWNAMSELAKVGDNGALA